MRQALEHQGGYVTKFIGDAVVGLFGFPVVREDDALRAVRPAAAMRGCAGDAPTVADVFVPVDGVVVLVAPVRHPRQTRIDLNGRGALGHGVPGCASLR